MKRQGQIPMSGYYAPLPGMANSPAASMSGMMGNPSMTPPPSLSGSSNNLTMPLSKSIALVVCAIRQPFQKKTIMAYFICK